ncbi:MAG: LysE family transporter [Candidatus Hadarchaeales archaeon]
MLQTLVQFPIGFVIALSGALVPGPLLAYVVAKSAASGKEVGSRAVVGHVIIEIFLLSLLLFGLGVVLQSVEFQMAIGIFGGASLLPLGVLTLRGATRAKYTISTAITGYPPIIGGIIYSTILNPTVIIWWATIGFATIMDAYVTTLLPGVALWLAGHWLADFWWFSFISISVVKGKKIIGSRGYKILLLCCGLLLLLVGASLLGKYGGRFFRQGSP